MGYEAAMEACRLGIQSSGIEGGKLQSKDD